MLVTRQEEGQRNALATCEFGHVAVEAIVARGALT